MHYSRKTFKQNQCDLYECKFADRHYRVKNDSNNESNSKKIPVKLMIFKCQQFNFITETNVFGWVNDALLSRK